MRCYDNDIKTLKSITDGLMKNDKEEKGGKLTVVDDLVETREEAPIPLQGGVTYKRPDENASDEEKKKWNNALKQIFGQ